MKGKRILFVINAFAELSGLVRDVSKVYTVFTDPELGMCENEGRPYHNCKSRSEFQEYFSQVLYKWNACDQLLFYFAGHGDIRKGNKYCLKVGANDRDYLPFENLLNDLAVADVRRAIFILDSCYSGAATEIGRRNEYTNIFSSTVKEDDIPKGIAILASSRKTQTSLELENGTQGVFTKLLCDGIETGLNKKPTPDGYISLEDIVSYINHSLDHDQKYSEYSQRSVFSLHGGDRSIWLAKNRSGVSNNENKQVSSNIKTSEDLKILYEQTIPNAHPCINTSLQDLEWSIVTRFFERVQEESIERYSKEQVASILNLYSPIQHSGNNYLHLSAVLCFCKEPERICPQAKSILVVGNPQDTDFIREEFRGPLSHQVQYLIKKTKKYINITSFINEDGMRQEIEDLDSLLIRELISNAVAHRDYQLNSNIKITITVDFFEILSPGKFPSEINWKSLTQSSTALSIPINVAISHYQSHLLAFEGIGRGFSIIKDYIKQNGLDSITCSELDGPFTCIRVRRRSSFDENITFPNKSYGEKNNVLELAALELASKIYNKSRLISAISVTPHNLPRSGVVHFIGREQILQDIHTQIQKNDRIISIFGMGGIGKTEIALQYAISQISKDQYTAGMCWIRARDQEVATQIVNFAQTKLGLVIPEKFKIDAQIEFCWQQWPEGEVLIVLDDVTNYDVIQPYLPPSDPRFKLLITTRSNLGRKVENVFIGELDENSAISLLTSLVGEDRVQLQIVDAKELCKWVGHLPLALDLLGRFLARKPDWTIDRLLIALENNRLDVKALLEPEAGMTAKLGIAAALELSWQELNEAEQELACVLGMFAIAPIPWPLVKQCLAEVDPDELEDIRDDGLLARSLLKRVGEGSYQLHQIVQEYFRIKLEQRPDQGQKIRSSFCQVMVEIAQTIDQNPTIDQIEQVRGAIVHLEEVVNRWIDSLLVEDLICFFMGVGRFYEGQGNYAFAEPWYKRCLEITQKQLGSEHPDVATSFYNLAELYKFQGFYKKAEPLYIQSIKVRQNLLGLEHLDVATSFDNLAELYKFQGFYKKAEPLHHQALQIRQNLLGSEHPDIATSLNNLASLYQFQRRYEEAEPLHRQALQMRQKWLGSEHQSVATSLNNLASLYQSQGRYEEAEPLHRQALQMRLKLLGSEHPSIATSLCNLASLYQSQGCYEKAELLHCQALQMRLKLLGSEHPSIATSQLKLGTLYQQQGKYSEARSLYLQAIVIAEAKLGPNHPTIRTIRSSLKSLPQGS
jgi:tetratricopeptide (TPR) repeat protein